MRYWLLSLVLWYGPPSFAWAAQVCLERTTGRLLEYQSDATPGTCTRNAVASGMTATEVEEHEVTEAEWQSLKARWIDHPAQQAREATRVARQQKATVLRQKLNLTEQEFEELREALR